MAQPLRRQIVLLNLAILVPVFLVFAWAARATFREQINTLEAESRSTAATVVALLERGLNLTAVQTVISAIPLPTGAVVTVSDEQSTVLARSRDPEQYVGSRITASALPMAEVPAFVIRDGMDGVERVFANALFRGGPYMVSVGIPTAVASERVAPIFRRNLLIVISVTVFTLLLEFLLLRPYTRAFDRAIKFAGRVAAGDLTTPEPTRMPSLEMERLQASVIEMLTKLREAREAVAAQVAEERRMRQELESLQRQVIRQERLAAIGVLVSGVAHELNNPLQAILGFAELLQIRNDVPEHVRGELLLIQKESARASVIIRNLSRFSRQQSAAASPVRLRDVVSSVVELRQRKLEEDNIALDVHEDSDPPVVAVFQELQQVVLNFMINAEQAVMVTPEPRRIIIRVTGDATAARLEVEDSGHGVLPDDESKLFQPFFTTKPVGEGTGLGLSVSYGIIESHGGSIGYRRAASGGAVFYFDLPAAPSDEKPA
ncbi:MAG TPA: ATP-binding protein [Vicinamibacterales bacterium]|nr:ATP-binding protein [Vicinamibacterales bacterium]